MKQEETVQFHSFDYFFVCIFSDVRVSVESDATRVDV